MFTFWLSFSSRSGDKTEYVTYACLKYLEEKKKKKVTHCIYYLYFSFHFRWGIQSNTFLRSAQSSGSASQGGSDNTPSFRHTWRQIWRQFELRPIGDALTRRIKNPTNLHHMTFEEECLYKMKERTSEKEATGWILKMH